MTNFYWGVAKFFFLGKKIQNGRLKKTQHFFRKILEIGPWVSRIDWLMPRALTWLNLYGREAVLHKHKNSLKAPKMHLSFLFIVIGVIYFRMEEIKTLYKFRPDEIFRRITVTSLATLMIECSKLEYQQEDSARLSRYICH